MEGFVWVMVAFVVLAVCGVVVAGGERACSDMEAVLQKEPRTGVVSKPFRWRFDVRTILLLEKMNILSFFVIHGQPFRNFTSSQLRSFEHGFSALSFFSLRKT